MATLGQILGSTDEQLESLEDTELIGILAGLEALGAVEGKAKAKAKVTATIARKAGRKAAMAVPKSNNINGETRFLTDKALFENRLSQLNKEIVEKLKRGELQICDWSFYAVKDISGLNNVKMFEDGDLTTIGKTNVVQGRMFPEDHFLATSIYVGTCTASAAVTNGGVDLPFAAPIANVTNGEFKLGQESTVYMEKTSAKIFDHGANTSVDPGYYRLEAPKMFYPQRTLRWEFDLVGTVPANTFMRVEIRGVRTMKA